MLLRTLSAILLEHLLTAKGTIKAGKSTVTAAQNF